MYNLIALSVILKLVSFFKMTYSQSSVEPAEVGEQLNLSKQMDTYERYLILKESQVYLWKVPGLEAMLTVIQLCWAKHLQRIENNRAAK